MDSYDLFSSVCKRRNPCTVMICFLQFIKAVIHLQL